MKEFKGKLIVDTIEELLDSSNIVDTFSKDDHGNKYSNNIVTFDTESCQIDINDETSVATTVTFQIAVNDRCILVRTPEEFLEICKAISDKFGKEDEYASTGKLMKKGIRAIVFVHNLQYDAYFTVWDVLIASGVPVNEVFLIKKKFNKYNYINLQFRCSLMLLGMGLESAIKEYVPEEERIDKLVGGWDYNKIRSPLTKLVGDEELYACIDVLGLVDVIRNLCKLHSIEVGQLPVASTSFTRNACKDYVIGKGKYITSDQAYNRKLIHSLQLTLEQLFLAKESFRGGIADTNRALADEFQYNPGSWDICSEYPAQINGKLYPMSSPVWEYLTFDDLVDLANHKQEKRKGFITKIVFKGFKAKKEKLIPLVTKYGPEKIVINGKTYEDEWSDIQDSRIFEAETIILALNDVDFKIVCSQYDFKEVEVLYTMTFKLDYLPKRMREFILNGYKNKTNFKGVVGKELAYKLAKIYINAIYGIMATYPLFERSEIDGAHIEEVNKQPKKPKNNASREEWEEYNRKFDEYLKIKDEELEKYNNNPGRFVYYLWGVYTAAYGHEALCEGLDIVGSDAIACDTDSVKFRNASKYMDKFRQLNVFIEQNYKEISERDHIDWDKYSPADPSGETHTIGTWDDESEDMIMMVSKRSKCYLMKFEHTKKVNKKLLSKWDNDSCELIDGSLEEGATAHYYQYKLTTAGIKPQAAMSYFRKLVNDGKYKTIEDVFVANVDVPAEYTGKMTHVYHDDQKPFTYIDCDGNEYTMTNTHSITLKPAPFAFTGKDEEMKPYYYGFFESREQII